MTILTCEKCNSKREYRPKDIVYDENEPDPLKAHTVTCLKCYHFNIIDFAIHDDDIEQTDTQ